MLLPDVLSATGRVWAHLNGPATTNHIESRCAKDATTWPPQPCLVYTSPSSVSLLAMDEAVDFKLRDPNGTEVSLFGLLNEKPVMLEFGSYT